MFERLSDEAIAELKTLVRDLRLHAKHADAIARADRERGDSVSERMWKLEAKALRRRAKEHEEAIVDERLTRRIERSLARLPRTTVELIPVGTLPDNPFDVLTTPPQLGSEEAPSVMHITSPQEQP